MLCKNPILIGLKSNVLKRSLKCKTCWTPYRDSMQLEGLPYSWVGKCRSACGSCPHRGRWFRTYQVHRHQHSCQSGTAHCSDSRRHTHIRAGDPSGMVNYNSSSLNISLFGYALVYAPLGIRIQCSTVYLVEKIVIVTISIKSGVSAKSNFRMAEEQQYVADSFSSFLLNRCTTAVKSQFSGIR